METINQKENDRSGSTAILMDDVPTKLRTAIKKVLTTKMKLLLQTLYEEALTNASGSTHRTPDQLG